VPREKEAKEVVPKGPLALLVAFGLHIASVQGVGIYVLAVYFRVRHEGDSIYFNKRKRQSMPFATLD